MANSPSPANQRYKQDVPHEISEKIDLFYRQEQLIFTFESQLNDLKAQHHSLEQELQPYRIDAHLTSHKTVLTYAPKQAGSIHGLPDELLSHIFEIYIDDPSDTRRDKLWILLLVCKRWHSLVMKNPLFWARIEVDKGCQLFEFGDSPITTYIKACISRSKSIPLDMDLALRDFDFSGYVKAGLFDRAKTIVDEEFHQEIRRKIYKDHWNHRSSHFFLQLGRFFDNLFGDNGQHLRRCRNLDIQFPHNEGIARAIWVRMWSNLSNLTSLTLYGIPTLWSKDDTLAQIDLPRLKYLEVGGAFLSIAYPIMLFSASPTELKQFSTVIDCSIAHFVSLSPFQNLRTLELECWNTPSGVAAPTFSLHLAYLRELSIIGRFIHFREADFDFPALRMLRIRVGDGHQRLPVHLSPEFIEWGLRHGEFIGQHKYLIEDILLISKKIRKIWIPKSQKAAVLEQVRKYRAEGVIPSLSRIIVGEKDNELEVIDVQDIV